MFTLSFQVKICIFIHYTRHFMHYITSNPFVSLEKDNHFVRLKWIFKSIAFSSNTLLMLMVAWLHSYTGASACSVGRVIQWNPSQSCCSCLFLYTWFYMQEAQNEYKFLFPWTKKEASREAFPYVRYICLFMLYKMVMRPLLPLLPIPRQRGRERRTCHALLHRACRSRRESRSRMSSYGGRHAARGR